MHVNVYCAVCSIREAKNKWIAEWSGSWSEERMSEGNKTILLKYSEPWE